MTQKILAAHCGKESLKAGDMIMADLDLVLGNDITSPVAINEYEKAGCDEQLMQQFAGKLRLCVRLLQNRACNGPFYAE